MTKSTLFGLTTGILAVAWVSWALNWVSPTTGPYWYFYAASAAIFAILYAGTREPRD